MKSSYTIYNKNRKISYGQKNYLKSALKQLGINPNNNGFSLIKYSIIYAYEKDIISINLEELYKYLSQKTNISTRGIESLIRYSFYNINTKKLFANYENIFGINFNQDCFTIKNLISDFIDILEEI